MAKWHTVVESKVVWALIGTVLKKDGTPRPKFSRLGIKIEMENGSHWFHSFRHGSWTFHDRPVRKMDALGRPAFEDIGKKVPAYHPPKKQRWGSWNELQKEYGNRCPNLLSALEKGINEATATEE